MKTIYLTNDIWVANACLVVVMVGIFIFTFIETKKIQYKKARKTMKGLWILSAITFFLYLGIVLYATLIGRIELGDYKHMFDPCITYKAMFEGSRKSCYDVLQNVLFFIPFGIYLFFFFHPRMKWYHAFLLSALFSGLIETTQLVAKLGCCQTADVINNALGGLLGFLLATLLSFGLKRREG